MVLMFSILLQNAANYSLVQSAGLHYVDLAC